MTEATVGAPISAAEVTKAAKPTAEKKPKAAKPKAQGPKAFVEKFRAGTIGRMTVELIVAGKMSNDEILKAVKLKHKGETTAACIAWYRSKARAAGVIK